MEPELAIEKALNLARQSEFVKKQQDMLNTNFKNKIQNSGKVLN